MTFEFNIDRSVFMLTRDDGTAVCLTGNEVSFIVNQSAKHGLRDTIEYFLRDMDGDSIDLDKYPDGFDSLVDEVFIDLEDEVDYGNMPDDDDVQEKILDVASYYDMLI